MDLVTAFQICKESLWLSDNCTGACNLRLRYDSVWDSESFPYICFLQDMKKII